MNTYDRSLMGMFCLVSILACGAALPAGPPPSAPAASQTPGQQTPQSLGTTNSIVFDLQNDPTLGYPPAEPDDPAKPTAAMFCFKASLIDAATQPIIVATDQATNFDVVSARARGAIHAAQDAIGYYLSYEDIPGKFGTVAFVSTQGGGRKSLHELKSSADHALSDMNDAIDKAESARDKKHWAEYLHQVDLINTAVQKGSRAADTAKSSHRVINVDPAHANAPVTSMLNDLVGKGDEAVNKADKLAANLKQDSTYALPVRGVPCADPRGVAPMQMGMDLYARVDFTDIDDAAWPDMKLITLGVTTSAGSPINPTPIRAGISQPTNGVPGSNVNESFGLTAEDIKGFAPDRNPAEAKARARTKYLRWPYPLAGDSNVSLTLSLLYTPPNAYATPEVGRYYPVGSVIVEGVRCYAALGQVTGAMSPDQDSAHWAAASSCTPTAWSNSVGYPSGSMVSAGTACFVAPAAIAVNQAAPAGNPAWKPLLGCGANAWSAATTPYPAGSFVFLDQPLAAAASSLCYIATQGSTYDSATGIDPETWQRMTACTTTPPASASEATVSIVNQTLPPVHALSVFNLTTGVVYSGVRNRTFGYAAVPAGTTPSTTCNVAASTSTPAYNCVQTGSSPIIDPVLFFTYYPHPIDAERPYRIEDMIPGLSLGISLSSPSSNFYVGFSSEIRRNVQLVYGFTAAKRAYAVSSAYNAPVSASSASPATVQKFDKSFYVGLSFNILGFIQSLTGGGGGGGATTTSSPSK
jgi:hypothetical protein